jgi:hypothetical protein
MAAVSGHSFNIGPYGKNVLKIFPLKPVSLFALNWLTGFRGEDF